MHTADCRISLTPALSTFCAGATERGPERSTNSLSSHVPTPVHAPGHWSSGRSGGPKSVVAAAYAESSTTNCAGARWRP
eukprot:scaffold33231_cov36-Phaeocystis_antarctica.AAC.1